MRGTHENNRVQSGPQRRQRYWRWRNAPAELCDLRRGRNEQVIHERSNDKHLIMPMTGETGDKQASTASAPNMAWLTCSDPGRS